MSDENLTTIDLFGNEVYLGPRGRGRPPFQRTEKNARKVSMLLAAGWSNARIAGCIVDPRTGKSISEPTLKRHFRSELKLRQVARDQLDAKRLMMAFDAAEGGNVGAMRLLDQLIEKNDRLLSDARLGDQPVEPKIERRGKKELSAEAAREADDLLSRELEEEARGAAKH